MWPRSKGGRCVLDRAWELYACIGYPSSLALGCSSRYEGAHTYEAPYKVPLEPVYVGPKWGLHLKTCSITLSFRPRAGTRHTETLSLTYLKWPRPSDTIFYLSLRQPLFFFL